jgi:hypothetical protein
MPEFTFDVWLSGLITAIIVLTALSRFAFAGSRWMTIPSYIYGVLMFMNGLGHLAGTAYMGRPMPGVYSAPLLIAASTWLIVSARCAAKEHREKR